ncbi:Cytochrome P450 [Venustampulla echinocandica]|uniref:Cytochrome P450 n=1 Tax=Venustampulla echinocandica TaxID=2656787 RepID=A0A370TYM2_9HELO|nr:Cytochrome P450 [Venustampulla echinocandica]RDL40615.1 Cytochrome P450 [Venustampulla echinocandica]
MLYFFISGLDVSPVLLLVCLLVVYWASLVIFRLYLSPLSKFPGSKLAAATLWYEFYYEVIQRGQFSFKIREWHEQYGPVVRINPFEIHVDDPDGEFYHVVFAGTAVRDKHEYYTAQFGTGKTGFGTVSHYLHRVRRRALNPFFQPASILQFEPVIRANLAKLCERIDQYRKADLGAMPMRIVYMCLTTDVITSFALNYSWNHLDSPDFNPWWWHTTQNTAAMSKWTKQFPWLLPIFKSLPDVIVGTLNPALVLVLHMQRKIKNIVEDILEENRKQDPTELEAPRTIFHQLLDSDMPPKEKQLENLWQEGQNVLGAGADTVALVLTLTTYYLLENPSKLLKLKNELKAASKDKDSPLSLVELQSLPYLTGVVLEGLRLSYGTTTRLTRIAPTEDLKLQDLVIPAGTPISMSAICMHHNEQIFPDSHSFTPERWSDQPDGGKALERYMVSFSKGSRQCIGMGLAKAEIILTIATIFTRYDNMELVDMDFERDVALKHDMFLPQPSKESRGVRVLFKANGTGTDSGSN